MAPLRGIDARSGVLLEDFSDRLGDDGGSHIEAIRGSIRDMAHLVDSLVDVSHAGRAFELVVAPDLAVTGAPTLLGAVEQNLIGNAWRLTGRRERARIEIGVARREGENAYVVADDGAGFLPGPTESPFRPFQRLHRKDELPGAGVGLATVDRIVSRHRRRVWAEPESGRGAIFVFPLPRAEEPGPPSLSEPPT